MEKKIYKFFLLQKGRLLKIYNSLPTVVSQVQAPGVGESLHTQCKELWVFELGKNIFNLDYI